MLRFRSGLVALVSGPEEVIIIRKHLVPKYITYFLTVKHSRCFLSLGLQGLYSQMFPVINLFL